MQHPNTVAVEWAKNLELLPAVCREFISNPGSEDHLLSALTESVLSLHRPNRAAAIAADPFWRRSLGRSSRGRARTGFAGGSTSAPSFWVPEAARYRIDGDRPGSQEAGRGSAGCGNRSGHGVFFFGSRLQNNKFARFGSLAPPASVQHGDPRTSYVCAA